MPGPKHLARASHRSGRERLLVGLGVLLTMVLVASASVLGYLNFRFGQITRFDVEIDVPPASGAPRNYLLVGSDSRAGLDEDDPANAGFFDDEGTISADGPLRTDTIMLLRVWPDTGEAALLSFPRDLWIPIADDGENNRINVAFTRGREVLMATIRENFDVPIHHYVEIDFVGFLGLVEAVGGIPLYFETPVRDTESGLSIPSEGCVVLDGRQSLAFARARHLEYRDQDSDRWRSDPSGDLGRISRQQEFIRRAIAKAVSRGLSNPARLNDLVDVAIDYVGLDPTLSARDILSLGRRFADFDAESLRTYSIPAEPFRTAGGASVLDMDERGAERILNIFRGLDPDETTPGMVEVTVLNGTGEQGFAADITAALDHVGFQTDTPSNTDEPVAGSTIHYGPDSKAGAVLLARHLSTPTEFVYDQGMGPGEVMLVAGADFTTVHEQASPTTPEIPTPSTEPTGADAPTSTTSSSVVGYVPDANRAASCS